MNSTGTKIFAGTTALVLACSASSLSAQPQDYSTGSPYPGAPTGPGSSHYYWNPFNDKLYLGFDIGAAFQQDITLSDSIGDSEKVTFGTGARLDCQLGYNFTPNWAAEVEVGLVISPVAQSYVLGTDFMSVDYTELPVMVNVLYTRPLGHHFSAYGGGGIGGVFSGYSNDFGGSTPTESAFGFQVMAGIKYVISDRWDFRVAYKFLGTTGHDVGSGYDSNGMPTEFRSDGNLTHSVLLVLTCKF